MTEPVMFNNRIVTAVDSYEADLTEINALQI
jgi:hypothetical protein